MGAENVAHVLRNSQGVACLDRAGLVGTTSRNQQCPGTPLQVIPQQEGTLRVSPRHDGWLVRAAGQLVHDVGKGRAAWLHV